MAGETHPWDNKRIHYIIEYQGRIREKGFFVRRPGSFRRQPCIIIEEEKTSFADYDPNIMTMTSRIKTITTPTGEAVQRTEDVSMGGPGHETVNINSGLAEFAASGIFGTNAEIPVPSGVLFEVSGEWLAGRTPRLNATAECAIIDRVKRTVSMEQVRIVEQISAGTTGGGGQPAVWLAEFVTGSRPPLLARFTSDGRLLRLETESLVYQVVTKQQFEQGRIPTGAEPPFDPFEAQLPPPAQPGYDPLLTPMEPFSPASLGEPDPWFATGWASSTPSVPITDVVPAWDSFAWLIFQASPSWEWSRAIVSSDYSQLHDLGTTADVLALRNAPRVDAAATLPMSIPPDVQPYLNDYNAFSVRNPVIIDGSRVAVMNPEDRQPEANVLRAVSYLAGWINQTVAVTDWQNRAVYAPDVLSAGSADSLGHARLFAAMARSLGIPTRLCQGFLAQPGRASFHCWAEAWINGIWMPVDTTVSRVGLPAGYVLAERSGPEGVFRQNFAAFMRTPGLMLQLASGGRETPSGAVADLIVGNRRTYAVAEGDWLANLYWGFALRLPPAWNGAAKLNSVEAASPDRLASVKCEAMVGDYRAGQAELDANVASLRASLQRFRLVESRVVAFDPEGATPALFIDFSCQQEGVSLRCRQYVLPRRGRAFRLSFWAPADRFPEYAPAFDSILASFEY